MSARKQSSKECCTQHYNYCIIILYNCMLQLYIICYIINKIIYYIINSVLYLILSLCNLGFFAFDQNMKRDPNLLGSKYVVSCLSLIYQSGSMSVKIRKEMMLIRQELLWINLGSFIFFLGGESSYIFIKNFELERSSQ